MITLLDPYFWISFVGFFLAIFFAFFVPGDVLLTRLHLSYFQRLVLSTVLGMVLWGWQGFILRNLGLGSLAYVYLAIFFIL